MTKSTALLLIVVPVFLALVAGTISFAADQPNGYVMKEGNDRTVDALALASKRKAVATLTALVRSRENTAEEPLIIMRLVETLHSTAGIEFRVANGKAMAIQHPEAANLTAYKGYLRDSIVYLNRLITKFPRDPQIPRAIYLRAKAYKEIGQGALAVADFKFLIDHYPNAAETDLGNLSLCDLLIDNKDYTQAIFYLNKLAANPNDTSYPLAMDRLGWIYYYMNDIPRGISYLERELSYFHSRHVVNRTDQIDQEKAITNSALFYVTAMEKKVPGYDVAGAFSFFKRLGASGPELAKVAVHFAYLLRTKGFENELEEYAKLAMAQLPPAEGSDLLAVVMDFQIQKRRYSEVRKSAEEMFALLDQMPPEAKVASVDADRPGRAKKLLQQSAAAIQASFAQEIGHADEGALAVSLMSVYDLMLKRGNLGKADQTKIHFNLAETAFQEKNFDLAVYHYRWVVDQGDMTTMEGKKLAELAQGKMIAGRYESLKTKDYFPHDLKPVALGSASVKEIPPEVSEFIKLIDLAPNKNSKELEGYTFESSRMLYALGHIPEALDRFYLFIKAHPKSQYAIPSASLIVDTYVASGDWDKTHEVVVGLMNTGLWKGDEFERKLYAIAGDAWYKTVETAYKKGDYTGALKRADFFLKNYKTSSHRNECLSLCANASLGLKDKKGALAYFAELQKSNAMSGDLAGTSLLTSGSVAEDAWDLDAAATTYWNYLNLPKEKRSISDEEAKNLKRKEVFLAWMTGNPELLQQALVSPKICGGDVSDKCQEIATLSELNPSYRKARHFEMFKFASTVFKQPNALKRLVFAAIALDEMDLSTEDTYRLTNYVAKNWDKADPLAVYILLPHFSKSIPIALDKVRKSIKDAVHLKIDKHVIAKRAKLMEEMQSQTASLLQLPWARIKVAAVNEIANLYEDFDRELLSQPAPAGLAGDDLKQYQGILKETAAPYEKKRSEAREKAIEIVREAPVDDKLLEKVFSKYLVENADFAKQFGHGLEGGLPDSINPELFEKASGGLQRDDKSADFKRTLIAAMKAKNWPKISFLLSEAKSRGLLPEGQYHVAQAVSLAIAGATAEAIPELFASRDALNSTNFEPKIDVLVPMICSYYNAFSVEKTKLLVEEFGAVNGQERKGTAMNEVQAQVIAKAANWSGAKVSNSFSDHVVGTSQSDSSRGPANSGSGSGSGGDQ